MIDHVLGRPSNQFRKIQVFAVVSFWSLYLLKGNNHGPPFVRALSAKISSRLTAWQTLVITLLWLYISRNFAKICGLECPEPLANLYTRSYFRATWVTTALDAGFWTAMRIKRRPLRDLASIVFSVYYLFAAEQADEKARKVRGALTLDHLRVSWNKGTTPYLSFFSKLLRPRLARYGPRKIRIPRPRGSAYRQPVTAWLYYDGPLSTIARHDKIVLDVPGGGFVAMDPRTNDDKLLALAGKTGLPLVSLDYRKAPEHPYPYALNECFDVYRTIVATNGRCIGLSGEQRPRVVITGDSAGGNLATGTVLMILQANQRPDGSRLGDEDRIPVPEGLILMYPALDMNINSWMTDEQMSLIQDQRTRAGNRSVLRKKSEDYYRLDSSTPHPSDDEEDGRHVLFPPSLPPSLGQETGGWSGPGNRMAIIDDDNDDNEAGFTASPLEMRASGTVSQNQARVATTKPRTTLRTRLAMSSMISYFNDRILTPEMMRAMIILYVGPHARPDFTTDFLLSPLLAPESLLAGFPKTHFLTGERDPLVDDTVIFAGRLRQAKHNLFVQRKELGLLKSREVFDERNHVEVALIPGISHGFLQFVAVFPQGWRHIARCARWILDIFGPDLALEPAREGGRGAKAAVTSSSSTTATAGAGRSMAPGAAVAVAAATAAAGRGGAAVGSSLSPRRTANGTAVHPVALSDGSGTKHHRRMPTADSSGDEDRPLEMTALSSGSAATAVGQSGRGTNSLARTKKRGNNNSNNNDNAVDESGNGDGDENGDGDDPNEANSAAAKRERPRRQQSGLRLGSQEDLLKRRMKGLASGLLGSIGPAPDGLKTP